MSGFSPFEAFPSSKKILPSVNKLRRAIKRGELDSREGLIEALGALAISFASESRFDKVLETWDEIIELTETLLQEGRIEITQAMLKAVFSIPDAVRVSRYQQRKFPTQDEEDALFQRFQKCIAMLPEEEFLAIKNEWALENHKRAVALHEKGATIAAVALLDELLLKFEPLIDPERSQFTEQKPILDIYRSRGTWKCEIGDRESGIADLLRFEELAIQADELLKQNMAAVRKKNSGASAMEGGNIVIRLNAEDFVDFYASYNFQEERYEAIVYLADMYHVRAEKEKALEYLDKALAIVEDHKDVQERARFTFFAASVDVPFRKGALYAQYHRFDKAIEQYDLAVENVKALLLPEHQGQFEKLEARFTELSQARAEVLQHLGRFDEAKEAIETTKRLFVQARKNAEASLAAVEEEEDGTEGLDLSSHLMHSLSGRASGKSSSKTGGLPAGLAALLSGGMGMDDDFDDDDDNPLSLKNIFATPEAREKKTLRKAIPEGEKFDERKVLLQFGAMHNEAMMDVARAKIEMSAGKWRKALRLLLKARFIVDSPVIISFPEAKKNVLNIYVAVAGVYATLKEYEKSEIWYKRAIKHAQPLIDEGDPEAANLKCIAYKGLGSLYSELKRHDDALVEYAQCFAERARLIKGQEAILEGLDREYLRVHDNQKVMPLALLYREQVEMVRAIENQIFAINASGSAEAWARNEMEFFEKFRALLLHPEQADEEYEQVAASCAAMLRWGGEEEKCQELLERWVAEQKDRFETEDAARDEIRDSMAIRLRDLYAITDFHEGARLFHIMSKQVSQRRLRDAYETARVFRSFLIHEQDQLRDPPLIKREFYERIIKIVDQEVQEIRKDLSLDEEISVYRAHPYDPAEVRALLDQLEKEAEETNEEDEPEEDENASLYERDFEDAMSNQAMFLKMLDAYSGNNFADKILEEKDLLSEIGAGEDRKVGRNDPCPCGSGKKYKKCCGK